jgi:glycosyltransferase involved in cell wall biosynthesis
MTRPALLLTIDYAPQTGGVPRLLQRLVELSSDQWQWEVITVAEGPASDHVHRVKNVIALLKTACSRARQLHSRDDPLLIVCGHAWLMPIAVAARRCTGAHTACIVHGFELTSDTRKRKAALLALRRAGRVVAVSKHTAGVARHLGVAANRIEVANPTFAVRPRSDVQLASRNPDEPLKLIMVSRLREGYKNFEVIFRAIAILGPKHVARLEVVGSGPRLEPLANKSEMLGISDLVSFAGAVDDESLDAKLSQAHVALFPSRQSKVDGGYEGFGIAAQEMAAAGLPVLVGNCAGARDAAQPEWAYLLDPDDVSAWVDAIHDLYLDESKRSQMAAAARRFGQSIDASASANAMMTALSKRSASA